MMNFDILYSIAVDLINKKKVNNTPFGSKFNKSVCVFMTQANSIFTGVSGSAIKDGKLVSVCAEYETIKIMLNSNENKINALVTVDCQTLLPCVPCDDCKRLLLEINPENAGCFIMTSNKSFVKLKDLSSNKNKSALVNDIGTSWEDGWDDNITVDNSIYNKNPYDSIQQATLNSNSNNKSVSTLQVKPLSANAMPYQSSLKSSFANSVNGVSTLQTAVFSKQDTTSIQNDFSTNSEVDVKTRIKERLESIMATDDIEKSSSTSNLQLDRKLPKETLSKKELKSLAKEKKRQAKRNSKILQSIEKRSRT